MADWLQILGNIGIVIGLFFVGVQLYQDRQLKEAELTSAYFESRIQANIAAMGENPQASIVKAATNPEAMTPEDAYVSFLNLDNWGSLWMRYSRLESLGLQNPRWQDSQGLFLEFGTPFGVRWAKHYIDTNGWVLPEAFREKLEAQVAEPERSKQFLRRLEQLLEPVAETGP